jgi:hypothetical protein
MARCVRQVPQCGVMDQWSLPPPVATTAAAPCPLVARPEVRQLAARRRCADPQLATTHSKCTLVQTVSSVLCSGPAAPICSQPGWSANSWLISRGVWQEMSYLSHASQGHVSSSPLHMLTCGPSNIQGANGAAAAITQHAGWSGPVAPPAPPSERRPAPPCAMAHLPTGSPAASSSDGA